MAILANNGIMSEATRSPGQVVFEIKMKFSIEKSDEAFKKQNQEIVFLEKFIFGSFYFGSRALIIKAFLTPHDSINLTTVKFIESAPPQGGSYSP